MSMSRHNPSPAAVLASETQTIAGDASMKPPPPPQRPIILADLNVDPPDSENYAFSPPSFAVPTSSSRSHFHASEAAFNSFGFVSRRSLIQFESSVCLPEYNWAVLNS